jgi:hypothetical protein
MWMRGFRTTNMKMQPIESTLSYSNGFEKTECVGKKLKNIAPNGHSTTTQRVSCIRAPQLQAPDFSRGSLTA